MSEALDIIMERKGIKSLPPDSTERYPIILEAWKIFQEDLDRDLGRVPFGNNKPDITRAEEITRTVHEKESHNTGSKLFLSDVDRTPHENKPDRINRTVQEELF